jgi:ribose 5-phosphate isomerase A
MWQVVILVVLSTVCCTMATIDLDLKEQGKKLAAVRAVDEEIRSGMRVGIGSGSTVVYAVERLGQLFRDNIIQNIVCVPSSFQAKQLIAQEKLPLGDLDNFPELDVVIDGADSIDPQLNLIKGGGGACVREKILVFCAKRFAVIADESKLGDYLGATWTKGLPVEVIPASYVPMINKIKEKFGVSADLRMALRKAGPVVTDNGNFLLDVLFDWQSIPISDLDKIDVELLRMAGVVHTGFFLNMAGIAYVGMFDGSVKVLTK